MCCYETDCVSMAVWIRSAGNPFVKKGSMAVRIKLAGNPFVMKGRPNLVENYKEYD